MNRRRFIAALGIAAVFIPGATINATKPCEPSPCQASSSGELDRNACESAAAWVAVGKISKVVHYPAGYPLLKDFAQFTFTVERWEKGGATMSRELRFKVGWCENQQEPPSDKSGQAHRVRMFGAPASAAGEPRYLYLERLSE
jgi:hypothetical protein